MLTTIYVFAQSDKDGKYISLKKVNGKNIIRFSDGSKIDEAKKVIYNNNNGNEESFHYIEMEEVKINVH